jgi:hypothetical protein
LELRSEVLGVWKELQRIRRDAAALAEISVAQLSALTANINRDPKKGKPFTALDFCMFREAERDESAFTAEVAEIALALKHEDNYPPLLLAVWPQILASAKPGTRVPEVRALRSDDENVWVLAPKWEGRHCRGGLVLVRGRLSGEITLRDVDRPLVRHRFQLPERPGYGWIEAGHLLLAAET